MSGKNYLLRVYSVAAPVPAVSGGGVPGGTLPGRSRITADIHLGLHLVLKRRSVTVLGTAPDLELTPGQWYIGYCSLAEPAAGGDAVEAFIGQWVEDPVDYTSNRHEYTATVTAVYDGDTITCDVALGLGMVLEGQKVRLYGIDCPEMRGKTHDLGVVSRDRMRALVLNKVITLETNHGDRRCAWGRLLAFVYMGADRVSCNDLMIAEGLAVPYMTDQL